MMLIDLTWLEFRALPIESRRHRIEEFKAKGFGIFKLARIWNVTNASIHKALETSSEISELSKGTVKERLEDLVIQMEDGTPKQLIEIAIQTLGYEINTDALEEMRKENERLNNAYNDLKKDFATVVKIQKKYEEVSNAS